MFIYARSVGGKGRSRRISVSVLVVVAGVVLTDAQVSDSDGFIPQRCSVFETAVEAKLWPDHSTHIIELNVTSLVVHQQVSIPHPMSCELNAPLSIIGDLLPDLYPSSFEGGEGNLRNHPPFILQLHICSGCESQVWVADITAVELNLV